MDKKINTSGPSSGFIEDPTITPFPINWNRLNKIRFEDAPTDYILLCKLTEKYNEIVEATNSLEEAMEKFTEWVSKNIEDSTIEQLNKWLEDGTFENLINEEIFANLNNEINELKKNLFDFVNIKEFGAVGDGITNDTQALRDAFAVSNKIFFPTGTYLIKGTYRELLFNVENKEDLYFIGDKAIISYETENSTLFNFVNCKNLNFEGITFQSNAQYQEDSPSWTYDKIIEIVLCENVTIKRCACNNCVIAFDINDSTNIYIYDNVFTNYKVGSVMLQTILPTHDAWNTTIGMATYKGNTNVFIKNNIFQNGYEGLKIAYLAENVLVSNNIFKDNPRDGVDITGWSFQKIVVDSNIFINDPIEIKTLHDFNESPPSKKLYFDQISVTNNKLLDPSSGDEQTAVSAIRLLYIPDYTVTDPTSIIIDSNEVSFTGDFNTNRGYNAFYIASKSNNPHSFVVSNNKLFGNKQVSRVVYICGGKNIDIVNNVFNEYYSYVVYCDDAFDLAINFSNILIEGNKCYPYMQVGACNLLTIGAPDKYSGFTIINNTFDYTPTKAYPYGGGTTGKIFAMNNKTISTASSIPSQRGDIGLIIPSTDNTCEGYVAINYGNPSTFKKYNVYSD